MKKNEFLQPLRLRRAERSPRKSFIRRLRRCTQIGETAGWVQFPMFGNVNPFVWLKRADLKLERR